jgi:hypothetical protein
MFIKSSRLSIGLLGQAQRFHTWGFFNRRSEEFSTGAFGEFYTGADRRKVYDVIDSKAGDRENIVNRQIRELRILLGEHGKFVETVEGVGYKFTLPAETFTDSDGEWR